MALSQTDLDALDLAIASGALSVEFDGRRVTYQSTAAMIQARNHVANIISQNAAPRRTGPWRFTFTTHRGD